MPGVLLGSASGTDSLTGDQAGAGGTQGSYCQARTSTGEALSSGDYPAKSSGF